IAPPRTRIAPNNPAIGIQEARYSSVRARLVRIGCTSVPDFDTAEYYLSTNDDTLRFDLWGPRLLVVESSKNGLHVADDGPIVGHTDFNAAEKRKYLNDRFMRRSDRSAAKIDLTSTENRCGLTSAKVLRIDATLETAQYRSCREVRRRR